MPTVGFSSKYRSQVNAQLDPLLVEAKYKMKMLKASQPMFAHLVACDAGVWLLAGPHDEGGGHIDHLGRQDLCSSEAGLRGPGAAQSDG